MEIIFWGTAAGLLYTFVGYPLLMGLLALVRPRPVKKAQDDPTISLIVAVHDEERAVRGKIENFLSLDYPREKLQTIVASDGSTDATESIVAGYATQGIELVALRERGGKMAALRQAVARATGEILVFTDASALLRPESLRRMVEPFADPSVGLVSGHDRSFDPGDPARVHDEGLYVRYEMRIRSWESTAGSIVGASGCFFAMRRGLWRDRADHIVEDLSAPIEVRLQGFRAVAEPEAVVLVPKVASAEAEFERRTRTATNGIVALLHHARMPDLWKHGALVFQLASHKLLRFLSCWMLIVLLVSSSLLAPWGWTYRAALFLQLLGWGFAGLGLIFHGKALPRWISFPFYFALVNVSIGRAWLRVLRGRTDSVWTPSRRALV